MVALGSTWYIKSQVEILTDPGIQSSRSRSDSIFWPFGHAGGRDNKYVSVDSLSDGNEVAYLSLLAVLRDEAIYKNTCHDRNRCIATGNGNAEKRLIKMKSRYTNPYPITKVVARRGASTVVWWKVQITDCPLGQPGQRSEGMAFSSWAEWLDSLKWIDNAIAEQTVEMKVEAHGNRRTEENHQRGRK